MRKWFSIWWYKYLWSSESWGNLVCRIKGHRCGVVWYSMGWEPDMSCKDCGEDLG